MGLGAGRKRSHIMSRHRNTIHNISIYHNIWHIKAQGHPLYTCSLHISNALCFRGFLEGSRSSRHALPWKWRHIKTVNAQARAWTPETWYRKHRTQGFVSVLSYGKFIIRLCFMNIWLTPSTLCINHMLCLHTFQDYPFGVLNAKHRLDDKPSRLNTLAKSLTWHIVTLQVTTAAISGLAASSWSEVNMTEISKSWIWSN